MRKIDKRYFQWMSVVALATAASVVHAASLDGRLYIDGYTTNANGYYADGSYFAMGANNPNVNVGMLQPSATGGYIELGTFQNFVTNPDVPHPQGWQGDTNGDGIPDGAAGTGFGLTSTTGANIFDPFKFFSSNTYVGTLPVSYQNGSINVAPTADVDLSTCIGSVCSLTADLSSWEVYWNGSTFQQGPRPDNTGPFVLATGTIDFSTMHYELDWVSQIKEGPFGGVKGFWHLEGTYSGSVVPVPAAVWLFGTGLIGLFGFARRNKH